MPNQLALENWSREYLLAPDIDAVPYRGDDALMDEVLYHKIAALLGEPVIGYIGGLHYYFDIGGAIPADTAAVPRRNHRGEDTLPVLLSKP